MPEHSTAVPGPSLDMTVGFASHLLLFGLCAAEDTPDQITLWDSRGVRRSLRVKRSVCFPDPANQYTLAGLPERGRLHRFIASLCLLDLIGLNLYAAPLLVQIEAGRKIIVRAKIVISVLGEHRAHPAEFVALLESAARHGVVDAIIPTIALALVQEGEQEFELRRSVELVNRLDFGFFVEGWIEEARSRRLHYISADGLYLASPQDVLHKIRPDVTAHLKISGKPPDSDDHGFLVNFAPILPDTSSFLVFSVTLGNVHCHGTLTAAPSAAQAQILEMIMHSAGPANLPGPEIVRNYLLPLFAEKIRRPEYESWILHDNGSEPRVSVVVPLFREYRFIYSLMLLQKHFPPHYEWIFVSDDPAIHQPILEAMRRRRTFFSSRTMLILNRFSLGFAGASNVGASIARGEYILFMNSDIWIDSPIPIDRAVDAIQAGRFSIMGFRLLYEDGSIQHDGMTFRAESLMHDLYVVDHPAKGTPAETRPVDSIAPRPAVTGALMLMRNDLFQELGGFDQAYVRGDFEDADLCLRARAAGHEIGLVSSNEIFHLERQSIGRMGSTTSQSALVYVNCITFNRRWRNFIESGRPKTPWREGAQ